MTTAPQGSSGTAQPGYRERLRVPLVWWLLGAGLVLSLWWVLVFAASMAVAAALAAIIAVLVAWALLSYGGATVEVGPDGLRAGKALIEIEHCGEVRTLDREGARRVAGRDADPRAYWLLRGYVPTAVTVQVLDEADPTPYWYISTRSPERLAAAIDTATGRTHRSAPGER